MKFDQLRGPPGSEGRHRDPLSEPQRARWMAAVFASYGLIAIAFLAINVPPFQIPDESEHFMRAAQLAGGGFVGTRFTAFNVDGLPEVTAGGLVDPAIVQAVGVFKAIPFHPETKVTTSNWAADVHWTGTQSAQKFPNTANYPPFFYLPSAVGILVGKQAKLSVVHTLMLARLLTGMTALAIGAAAIAVAGCSAAWIFAILTLPMSLFLMASASQDALLIACSALLGSLMAWLLRWQFAQNGKLLLCLVVIIGLLITARPPYAALAVLPLGLTKTPLRWRVSAVAACVASVGIWSAIAAATTLTNFVAFRGVDPPAQLAHLINYPFSAATVIWATLKQSWSGYIFGFIGVLGWLDTSLPKIYYAAGALMLGLSAVAVMLRMKGERARSGGPFWIAAGVLLSVIATFAVQYLTWTPVGHATVEGVQGRYFLPLALAGTALFPVLGTKRVGRLRDTLLLLIIGFPLVSLTIVMRVVILRYYLAP